MTQNVPSSQKDREEREAEALRANLRKRKEQQRAWEIAKEPKKEGAGH